MGTVARAPKIADEPARRCRTGNGRRRPRRGTGKTLTAAARRALAEAALRRREIDARAAEIAKAKEHLGRGGLEPVRYEDWEVKGLASDF